MVDCKPVITPMDPNATLAKVSAPKVEEKMYQSAIRLFMYTMIGTHPNLAYAVGVLSQHCTNPGEKHECVVKRVLRYLKETAHQKIIYKKMGDTKIVGYVNTDWGADKNNHYKLEFKKAVFYCTIQYQSRIYGHHTCWKRGIVAQKFHTRNRVAQALPMPLYVDNQSAIALSKNPELHSWMKHIGVCYHFICNHVKSGEIELLYVPTGNQITVLTKGLTKVKLDKFVSRMGLRKVMKVEAVQ
jgi:hypothetical protein